jgi:hypothetical protein
MISPFTVTTPVWISTSASRLEHIPAFDKYLFKRISFSLKDGRGSPFLTRSLKSMYFRLSLAFTSEEGFDDFEAVEVGVFVDVFVDFLLVEEVLVFLPF